MNLVRQYLDENSLVHGEWNHFSNYIENNNNKSKCQVII